MVRLSHRTLPLLTASATLSHGRGLGWHFVQNGTTGVLALEAMVVSPTLAIIFDIASNDPLTVNGHPAWGALWNFETNTATALDVVSDSFCASGGFLSNGTMVSVGGNAPVIPEAEDGRQALRFFGPCSNPAGDGCPLIEDPVNLHLVEPRWYPSSLRIFDGSLMVVGGNREATFFYNTDPANSIEFFPPKDGGIPRYSPFLERTLPANMFPRTIALPDGRVFMASNNQTIIYDVEKNTELVLPDIPNGVRVTNPFDGTATLLPLSPPYYIPEVLICGGTNTSDKAPSESLSSQDPASSQCSRMTLTPAGIKKGWEIEYMLEPRMMPEMILLPNGQVLIVNGAQTGYAAYASVSDPIGNSNADHPAYTPSLYTPDARAGHRISNKGMPTSEIARVYHSVATLTPKGNIFIAGSNPNPDVVNTTRYNTEFRVEYLNPPYMTVARPRILNAPKKILYNAQFTMSISVPPNLRTSNLKVALMDLGFSSHAFHSSSLLVFMEAQLSPDRRSLRIRSPPNNRIYPPGPAYIYVTIDDVSSEGVEVMVGTGASPPVPDQGVRL